MNSFSSAAIVGRPSAGFRFADFFFAPFADFTVGFADFFEVFFRAMIPGVLSVWADASA